jgi:hypothetical protein
VEHLLIGQLVLSETADTAEVLMLSTIWQQLHGKENTTWRALANITSTDIQCKVHPRTGHEGIALFFL